MHEAVLRGDQRLASCLRAVMSLQAPTTSTGSPAASRRSCSSSLTQQ